MNPLHITTTLGTIGELLVQARLLQYEVQAAPPLKDSGNDLIAIRRPVFRAIQVKTTTSDDYPKPDDDVAYDILAVVRLVVAGDEYRFDESTVFLLRKEELSTLSRQFAQLDPALHLNAARIDELFPRSVSSKL